MIATTIKFKKINHLAASTAVLLSLLFSLASCHKEYPESEIILEGKITSYNEFGAAMLDFTTPEMASTCAWPTPPTPASASQPTTSGCPKNSPD